METFAPRSLVNAHQSLPSLIGQGLLSGVMTVPTIPTFKFRPRLERLDWRRIRTVDVDRVARELDISTLQEHMAGVTFCNVEKEVCPHCQNPIDPVLLKVIQLVQLMVEYLLHWQDHLVISLQAAENKLKSLLQDREQLQKQLEKQADDMQTLKQELKQRKKIIASQEFMITAGLGGYHQCQHCDKAFLNSSFLQNHMQRQHPEQYDNRLTSETQSNVHSIKLEEEISKLKEQLTLTMSQLEAQQQTYLEQDQRCKEKELLKALEQWKDEEKERQKAQLEEMREMMLKEFKELSSKNALLQKKLYEMEEDSHKIWLDMTALQEEKVQLSVSMEERHRQDILKLQQQLKKKDEKWAFRMQKVQAMYKQEKEQFLHHLHRLHSSANTEEERNRKLVEKLERELQEQKKLILSQKEQIKKLTLNPPEYADKSTSPHVLDPVEDTSEKDGGKKTEIKKKKCGLRRSPIIKDLGPSVLQALLEEFRPFCTELFSIPEKKAKLKKQAQKSPVMRSPSVKELHPLLEQVLEELEPYCMELLHIIEKQAEVKKQTPKKTLRRSGIVKDLHPLFEQTLLEELEPTVKPDISRLSTVKEGTEQEKQEKRFSRFQQIREKLTQILRLRLKEKTDDNSSPEQHAQPRQLFGETPMRSRSGNLTTSMAQVVSRLLETRQRSHQPTQESYMSTPPKTSTPSVFSHSGFSKSSSEKDFKEESPVQRPRASVTSVRGLDTLPADSDSEWMDGSDAETSHLQLRRHSSQNEDKPQGGLITDLMRNLERIFAEQSSTKPEEGVDVLSNKSNVRQKLEDSERDETDDLDSCSSEENRHLPKTGLLSKRTSVWGSSAGKTLKNQHGSPSL
ncbi:zinc finger protein Dzip1-like isoform X2 [Scleropages formosus]|uniref:zinc finger protein Dzip1-like isoform X2 n=1 Tax=Scleropages formosus TaxID=113540 RepID=UPI0010FA7FC0|nr:zinc finger protein Dzip1-like isoform X2 [Scleropages formosus]